jgi:hypothetical protein
MDDVAIRKSSDPKAFKILNLRQVMVRAVHSCFLCTCDEVLPTGVVINLGPDWTPARCGFTCQRRSEHIIFSFHLFCYRKGGMMAWLGFDCGSVRNQQHCSKTEKDGTGSSLLAPPCLAQSKEQTNLPVPFDWSADVCERCYLHTWETAKEYILICTTLCSSLHKNPK